MSVIDFPEKKDPPEWLKKYYERGFRLIFYQSKQKGPSGQEAVRWTERSDQLKDYQEGQNVGIFTGHEISPGKFLADIDFDWTDGFPLAKHILPPTGFGFGRPSRATSHVFYTTPEPVVSQSFDNIDGKPFVELRGTKNDGSIGLQTMMPPSVHPNGENLKLLIDEDLGHVEDLQRKVTLYAVACMIHSCFPNHQLAHDARLATIGFLLTEGLTEAETSRIVEACAEASGNNVADVKLIVKTTVQRLKHGEHVYGKTALIKSLGDTGKAIVARIKEWIGGGDFLENSKGQIVANNQENVKRALDMIGIDLSFDLFAQKAMVVYENPHLNGNSYRGPLIDTIVRQAWLEIDEKFHFRAAKDFFYDVTENVAHKNKFHPIIDYLSSLKWDGEPRVDEWLIRGGKAADTEYVRAVSSIMLLAAVRRVTHPGCKYDEMLVLESMTQGLMKSTALRTLCPNDKWFSDDLPLNVDAKQIVERTLGKWIIEASDLSGMRRSQIEHLKGMLSRQTDGPVRLAYGRLPVEQPRQFIIVGTTNSSTYLTDSTGNRRFWPIRVKQFDIEYLKTNRDQIWAEAFAREGNGESIRLNPKLYGHATLQQERRRAEDPFEVKLEECFGRDQNWRLTPDEVWGALGIFDMKARDPVTNDRVLNAMNHLGFRRLTVCPKGQTKRIKGFGRDIEQGQMELEEDV